MKPNRFISLDEIHVDACCQVRLNKYAFEEVLDLNYFSCGKKHVT